MDEFFNQVAEAAQGRLYFLALAGALVIPDICSALEAPDGESKGYRYRAWFDEHAAPLHNVGEPMLDGKTCWKFRCSFLHQGTTQDSSSSYSRIMFIEPGATTSTVKTSVMDDALVIDVREFCLDMVSAALSWRRSVSGTDPYETNLKSFVTRYPGGLAPYMVGVPVIS